MSTSGVNAAATLTMEIATGKAAQELASLVTTYQALKKEFGTPLQSSGTKELQAQVASLTAEIDALTKAAASGQDRMTSHMKIMLNSAEMTGKATVKAFDDSQKELQRLSDTNLKIQLRSAEMTGNAILKSLGETEKATTDRAKRMAAAYDQLSQRAKVTSSDMKSLMEAMTFKPADASGLSQYYASLERSIPILNRVKQAEQEWMETSAARIQLAANSISTPNAQLASMAEYYRALERADAEAAAKRIERAQLTATAESEARLVAANKVIAKRIESERAYTTWWESELAKREAVEKAAMNASIRAAQANSARITASLASGNRTAATHDALGVPLSGATAQSADAVTSANTTLARSHAQVTEAGAKHEQMVRGLTKSQWEAHSAARGLAGGMNALWLTYGATAPLVAGAAISGSFAAAAKAGSEFAYQLKFVEALGGESRDAMQQVSAAVKDMAQNSMYGPVELASGMRILSQAGLDAASALKALPEATKLATVGEMSMEQAAVTLTGVMNAFSLTVEDMPHIGDVFAKAAAMSQTSVQGMTEAMKTASVVGEQYGTSMEDTATALTLLAKVNITGTAAGTAFRNMVKELYAPVPQAAKALENLGLKTKDAVGNLRPFADVIYDLKDRLQEFDKGSQVEILQRLFGERGAKEAVAMLSKTREEWDAMVRSISESSGFMDGVTAKLEDTAKGEWLKAINTLKTELVKAFEDAEPVMRGIATAMKDMFSSQEFRDGLQTAVSGMANLLKTLVELAPLIIKAGEAWLIYKAAMIGAAAWSGVATGVQGLTAAMASLSGVMGPTVTGLTGARGVIAGLPMLLGAIPTPLTIVAGLLAAGATAWALWGDSASRAGDKAYDSAARAEEALSKAARRQKYGVGDKAEALEELDKAENLLALRIQGKATGNSLSDARSAVEKWAQVVENLQREEYKQSTASKPTEIKNQNAKPKRSAEEILGRDGRAAGNRGALKDFRTTLNDNLSSGLKQEKLNLDRELLDIEMDLTNHLITSTEAQRRKDAATMESLEIEKLWIEATLADAQAAKDDVSIKKATNDLAEQEIKILKQGEQAILNEAKARAQARDIVADWSKATADLVDDYQLELEMIGKTASEIKRLTAARQIDKAARDQIYNADGTMKVEQSTADSILAEADKRKSVLAQQIDEQSSFLGGWKRAYAENAKNATDYAKIGAEAFNGSVNLMSSALEEFLNTGKLNWSKFGAAVASELTKITMMMLKADLFGSQSGGGGGLLSFLGIGGGSGGGSSWSGQAISMLPKALPMFEWAKGGTFQGSSDLHSYVNTIQSTPTFFGYNNIRPFANGGVFAEAGPEAVMPLARNSNGELGVKMHGGSKQSSVVVKQYITVGEGADKQMIKRAAAQGLRNVSSIVGGGARYG